MQVIFTGTPEEVLEEMKKFITSAIASKQHTISTNKHDKLTEIAPFSTPRRQINLSSAKTKYGEVRDVADITGYSRSYITKVISGKRKCDAVMSALKSLRESKSKLADKAVTA